ncbi:MAG: hypothetical protein NZ703_06775 [Gemmataceae bacterium]|nr:hypothetical protein [Gemmataceae bacterium]
MPQPNKRNAPLGGGGPGGGSIGRLASLAQQDVIDFEIAFYERLIRSIPDYVEVLQILAQHYRLRDRQREGLAVDLRLAELRPNDPRIYYNLACRYALLRQTEQALRTLRRALELGYRDFQYLEQDQDWDHLRKDHRFQKLLREFRTRS